MTHHPLRPVLALSLAVLSLGALAGVIDDAKFKLDLRGGASTYTQPGNLGNVFDYSAASPLVGYMGDQRGPQTYNANFLTLPTQEAAAVTNPYNPYTTNTQNVLHFYQDFKGADKGSVNSGIVIPGAAPQTSTQTFYVRFRWDGVAPAKTGGSATGVYLLQSGNSDNGNNANGVSLYLDSQSVSGSTTNIYVSCRVGANGGKHFNLIKQTENQIKAGEWNDVFLTIAQDANQATYTATLSVCKTPTATSGGFNSPAINSVSTNKTGTLTFNSTNLSLGLYHNSANVLATTRCFRGLIADFMIWERALTDNEKIEVMLGNKLGGEWQIGAVNNSADEFGDTDPAAVYDVQTMSWSRMRKTLDASNATLSLATTMTSSEHQMSRTLTFTPILSGATAPVDVALNGTTVGEIDLATTTSITLPKALWRHDGVANTITVTRTAAASGTIQFDAIALAPAPTATSVLDDAFFKLDLRGGASTFTQPGDLGNAFDFSSAAPLVGYMGDQRGPRTYSTNYGNLPAQEAAAVTNPYYPYTTNMQNVLHFYQDQKSATASVRSAIVIPGAAPQGHVQTFYVRFRWDGRTPASTYNPTYIFQSGNAGNGYKTTGVAVYIHEYSVSDNLATTNAYIGVRGSNSDGQFTNLAIKAGEWNDVFVTFVQNADNTAYTATGTLCKPVASGASNFSPSSLTTQSRSWSKALLFDTGNLTIGGYHDSLDSATTSRAFRGLIADFMIWDRALTDDEKIEVMAGQHGAKWRIGAINGSADEFTDDNPAAVYEPQTMPWRQMRKTLDSSHPTLTLKSPLATWEAGKAMILHVDPILTGTPAAVPVSVSVNGTSVGSFNLAEKRNFIIPKINWQRDGNGNVTVAITRTETTGSVAIDALSLSGSWQITDEDRGSNGMVNEKYAASHAFAGDSDVQHFTSSLSIGSSHTNYTFGVWVPAGMAEECGWKFRTKTTGTVSNPNSLTEQHTVYVNGTAVGTHEGSFGTYEPFSLDIPAGVLHDGMNYVQWVQTLPTRAAQQSNLGGDNKPVGMYQYYDFWGMTLVPPPTAFVLVIR